MTWHRQIPSLEVTVKKITFHDWVIIGSLTLVMTGFYGAELSFSVFLKPLTREFGWTRAMASGGLSAVEGIAGAIGILAGILTDRYGARVTIAIGGFVGGLGYLLMSRMASLVELYVYFGLMEGMAMAACWTPIAAVASRLYAEKRLLVLGIITIGISIGHMILPALSAQIIAASGWRFAYIVLSAAVWLTTIPAVILLGNDVRQRKEEQERAQPGKGSDMAGGPSLPRGYLAAESVKTAPFWVLMVTGFASGAGFYFVSAHIVAFATDIGITPTSAALTMTFMGIGNIIGKLLVWPMAARIGSRWTLFVLLAMQALVLFLLIQVTSLWMLVMLGPIFGFGFGGCSPVRTSMVPEFFGMRSVGTIIGLISTGFALGAICGPFLAGHAFDLSGSYRVAFFTGGLIMVIGMVSTYLLRAPKKGRAGQV